MGKYKPKYNLGDLLVVRHRRDPKWYEIVKLVPNVGYEDIAMHILYSHDPDYVNQVYAFSSKDPELIFRKLTELERLIYG